MTIERVASGIGLTQRTLRRRLSKEGTPFGVLLDQERQRLACAELRRPDSTIKATAERLGFSETSAFQRAFKRWTGCTPAKYAKATQPHVQLVRGETAPRSEH